MSGLVRRARRLNDFTHSHLRPADLADTRRIYLRKSAWSAGNYSKNHPADTPKQKKFYFCQSKYKTSYSLK